MRRVVVFGVFDLLHPGHLYFLREAKKHGTHLTVVVTRDTRVRKEKGRQPFFSQAERFKMIRALRIVDCAILGDRAGEWKVLKKLHSDVVCVGYDQNAEWIEKCALKKVPHIVRIKGWKTSQYNSSRLR